MRFPLLLILILFSTSQATVSVAGNKWMMEKNANELIMLNTLVLQQLGSIEKDGKVILSGDVIHRDGKIIIKLNQMQQVHTSADEKIEPEIFEDNLPYHIFLREDDLTEIPVPDQSEKEN